MLAICHPSTADNYELPHIRPGFAVSDMPIGAAVATKGLIDERMPATIALGLGNFFGDDIQMRANWQRLFAAISVVACAATGAVAETTDFTLTWRGDTGVTATALLTMDDTVFDSGSDPRTPPDISYFRLNAQDGQSTETFDLSDFDQLLPFTSEALDISRNLVPQSDFRDFVITAADRTSTTPRSVEEQTISAFGQSLSLTNFSVVELPEYYARWVGNNGGVAYGRFTVDPLIFAVGGGYSTAEVRRDSPMRIATFDLNVMSFGSLASFDQADMDSILFRSSGELHPRLEFTAQAEFDDFNIFGGEPGNAVGGVEQNTFLFESTNELFTLEALAPVPLPASFFFLLAGVAGLGAAARKRRATTA